MESWNLDWLVMVLTFTSWGYYLLTYLTTIVLRNTCLDFEKTNETDVEEMNYSIMIPALNEERVIGSTLRRFLKLDYPRNRLEILVINDGSTDKTEEKARQAKDDPRLSELDIKILSVPSEVARVGKGMALNRGYEHLVRFSRFRKNANWVIGVVDADGRMDSGLLAQANRKFSQPRVGSVNSSIRIRNRYPDETVPALERKPWHYRWLTTMQDIEFVTVARVLHYIRGTFLYNSFMGGNGQFMRYQVLKELKDRDGYVWNRDALTEDLEIGLRIYMNGWHTKQIYSRFMRQEGISKWVRCSASRTSCIFRFPLLRQRARWAWGNMQAFFKYIITGRIFWQSDKRNSYISRIDTCMLLSNWFFFFILTPMTLTYGVLYWIDVIHVTFSVSPELLWANGAMWLGFPLMGMMLTREYRRHHIFVLWWLITYIGYVLMMAPLNYVAFWRVITCQKPVWAKTSREEEDQFGYNTNKVFPEFGHPIRIDIIKRDLDVIIDEYPADPDQKPDRVVVIVNK